MANASETHEIPEALKPRKISIQSEPALELRLAQRQSKRRRRLEPHCPQNMGAVSTAPITISGLERRQR